MGRVEKTLNLGRNRKYRIDIPPQSGMAIGKVHGIGSRESQQDSFGVSSTSEGALEDKGILLVLADGMGGMYGGEKASMAAVVACLEYFDHDRIREVNGELLEMFQEANCQVRKVLGSEAGTGGSTAIAVRIKGGAISWVSVGDSRLCLCRHGQLIQLNRVHNYAATLEKMVRDGKISYEEAQMHPQRRALTSYLGMEVLEEIDNNSEKTVLKKNDRLILMSDGVFGTLSEKEIIEALQYPAEKATMRLGMQIEQKKKPNQDNYTAIVVEIIEQKQQVSRYGTK